MSGRAVTVTIPWVPDSECNPNNHRCSERTKVRHRKQGAAAAVYPMRAAYHESAEWREGRGSVFPLGATLDIVVRWGKGQKCWDDDNLVTAMKFVRDICEREHLVFSDKEIRIGTIVQQRASEQPETVLTLTEGDFM